MKNLGSLKNVNAEFKKVVGRVKTAQDQLRGILRNQSWVDDARKYAESQSKEVRKLVKADIHKVRAFLDKERKELEKFQKQIPSEVKKLKKYVNSQRKELERLLKTVRKASGIQGARKSTASKKRKKTSNGRAHSPSTTETSAQV